MNNLNQKFSIVIPLFNESDNIKKLFGEIIFNLRNYINQFEIIVIDDGSTDDTLAILKETQKDFNENYKILKNNQNIGQSYSLREGIMHSKYNTIVTIDGDCQNNPADIPKLLDIFFNSNKYGLVGGIRKNRKDNFIKRISSRIANLVRRLYLNDNCIDTGCSLKIFKKKIFLKFPYFDGIHRFLPALFSGYGCKTFFVLVDHRPRFYGYSKYKTFKRLYQGIFDMFKVKKIIKEYNKKKY